MSASRAGASGTAGLWVCPACGARLVTRNLSHSCGTWSLEALFRASTPNALGLAREYVAVLHSLGDVQVIPQKTRLVAVARVRFAGLSPRKDGFLANFALHRWVTSSRIVRTEDYGPRWRFHHLMIRAAADLDDELRGWLQESHDLVGLQARAVTAVRRQRPERQPGETQHR